jgi:hypothetical protein
MNSSAEPSEQPRVEVPSDHRFRWAMIPAALSWCLGVIMLFGCAAAIYDAFGVRPVDPGDGWPFQMLTYARLLAIPGFLIGGMLTLLAGSRWLGRRWLSAIVLNAIGWGVAAIPPALHDYAMDAAYRAMDAEDAAFHESLKAEPGVGADSR